MINGEKHTKTDHNSVNNNPTSKKLLILSFYTRWAGLIQKTILRAALPLSQLAPQLY